jgi:hypothetical protein
MPFDNFYKESDKTNHRYWKSVVSTFSLLVIVFISVYGLYVIYDDYQIEHAKETERIKRVNELCTNLRKPEGFQFEMKEKPVSFNNETTEIIYRYQSERRLEEIIPLFLVWFNSNQNGWKRNLNDELSFRNGNQTIAIRKVEFPSANYEIRCSVTEISFGIYD